MPISCVQLPASPAEHEREKGNSVPLSVQGKCPGNSRESETQITHLLLFLSSRRVFCIFPLGKKISWFFVKRRMLSLALPLGCSEEETRERGDLGGGEANRSFDPQRPEAPAKAARGVRTASGTENSRAVCPLSPGSGLDRRLEQLYVIKTLKWNVTVGSPPNY